MDIATWNIERLKHISKLEQIRKSIILGDFALLVLTEADTRLDLKEYPYRCQTEALPQPEYKPSERRVMIYSMYPIIGHLETFDPRTACCPLIETPIGVLAVYGTILGIYGNRTSSFDAELKLQIDDWKRISETHQLCIAGDFNMSFADNYYFTKKGRMAMKRAFKTCKLYNTTAYEKENVDHIVLSQSILDQHYDGDGPAWSTWNHDKSLSDHIGISICWIKFVL